ncbi:hypothetical protein MPSI1_000119 [Malassezia psittaci]|uniref:Protein transport protein sec16 n=1 Tax=Malassezia psittaci TaxID=1821823 RepID=A0AAF0JCL1_9BASI|nr:hypothetical protein MPSI1_000119 [Malassezia psittaci]
MAMPPRVRPQAAMRGPPPRSGPQTTAKDPHNLQSNSRHQPQPSVAAASSLFSADAPSSDTWGMTKSPTWLGEPSQLGQPQQASYGATESDPQHLWQAQSQAQPSSDNWDYPEQDQYHGEYQDQVPTQADDQYMQYNTYAQDDSQGFVDDAQYDQYLDDAQYDRYEATQYNGQQLDDNQWYANQQDPSQGAVQGLGVDVMGHDANYPSDSANYQAEYQQDYAEDDGFLDPSQYDAELDQAWDRNVQTEMPASTESHDYATYQGNDYESDAQNAQFLPQSEYTEQEMYAEGHYNDNDPTQYEHYQGEQHEYDQQTYGDQSAYPSQLDADHYSTEQDQGVYYQQDSTSADQYTGNDEYNQYESYAGQEAQEAQQDLEPEAYAEHEAYLSHDYPADEHQQDYVQESYDPNADMYAEEQPEYAGGQWSMEQEQEQADSTVQEDAQQVQPEYDTHFSSMYGSSSQDAPVVATDMAPNSTSQAPSAMMPPPPPKGGPRQPVRNAPLSRKQDTPQRVQNLFNPSPRVPSNASESSVKDHSVGLSARTLEFEQIDQPAPLMSTSTASTSAQESIHPPKALSSRSLGQAGQKAPQGTRSSAMAPSNVSHKPVPLKPVNLATESHSQPGQSYNASHRSDANRIDQMESSEPSLSLESSMPSKATPENKSDFRSSSRTSTHTDMASTLVSPRTQTAGIPTKDEVPIRGPLPKPSRPGQNLGSSSSEETSSPGIPSTLSSLPNVASPKTNRMPPNSKMTAPFTHAQSTQSTHRLAAPSTHSKEGGAMRRPPPPPLPPQSQSQPSTSSADDMASRRPGPRSSQHSSSAVPTTHPLQNKPATSQGTRQVPIPRSPAQRPPSRGGLPSSASQQGAPKGPPQAPPQQGLAKGPPSLQGPPQGPPSQGPPQGPPSQGFARDAHRDGKSSAGARRRKHAPLPESDPLKRASSPLRKDQVAGAFNQQSETLPRKLEDSLPAHQRKHADLQSESVSLAPAAQVSEVQELQQRKDTQEDDGWGWGDDYDEADLPQAEQQEHQQQQETHLDDVQAWDDWPAEQMDDPVVEQDFKQDPHADEQGGFGDEQPDYGGQQAGYGDGSYYNSNAQDKHAAQDEYAGYDGEQDAYDGGIEQDAYAADQNAYDDNIDQNAYAADQNAYTAEQDAYAGYDAYPAEQDAYTADQDAFTADQDPYAMDQTAYAASQDPYGMQYGTDAVHQEPYATESDPYMAQQDDMYAAPSSQEDALHTNEYAAEQEPYSTGPSTYAAESQPYDQQYGTSVNEQHTDLDTQSFDPYAASYDPHDISQKPMTQSKASSTRGAPPIASQTQGTAASQTGSMRATRGTELSRGRGRGRGGPHANLPRTQPSNLHMQLSSVSDPLQDRKHARIPIASFGIGGQFVLHRPQQGVQRSDAFGYDAPREQRCVEVRALATMLGSRTYSTLDLTKFPGPLLDVSQRGQAQKKKQAVVQYLEEQIDECASGVGYLRRKSTEDSHGAPAKVEEWRRTEDKILLLRLLLFLVQREGDLQSATQDFLALLHNKSSNSDFSAFSVPTYTQNAHHGKTRPLRSYTLRSSFLDQLQTLLQQGKTRQAIDLALQEKMFAHAMIIAQQQDDQVRTEVFQQFIAYELNATDGLEPEMLKDRTSIKVAYGVYTHQSPEQIVELFMQPAQGLSADAKHAQWRQSIATLLNNRQSDSNTAALLAIGDQLMQSELPEAAHVCYLLSGEPCKPNASSQRPWAFVGSDPGALPAMLLRDLDALIMTEVMEFAVSLRPSKKGEPPFTGFSILAPYKLALAIVYDEFGDSPRAQKYCESLIAASRVSKVPMYHPATLSELHQIMSRLYRQPLHGSDASSWVGRKLSRPTLDGMWGALEGRLTKFIAGEETGSVKQESASSGDPVGAFTHYSAITPDMAGSLDALSRSDDDLDAQEQEQEQEPQHDFTSEAYAEQSAPQSEPLLEYNDNDPDQQYQSGAPADDLVEYAEGEYAEGEYAEGGYAEDGYAEGEYAEGEYPEGGYAEGEYAEGGYAEDGYAESEYAEGEYPEGGYAEGEYAQGEYAEGEYPEGEYAQGEYAEGEYAEGEYPTAEYAEGEYPEGEYPSGEYPEGQYSEEHYAQDPQGEYPEGEYPTGEYAEGEYAEGDYAQGQYAEGEYVQGEYPNGDYAEGEYVEGEYSGGNDPATQYGADSHDAYSTDVQDDNKGADDTQPGEPTVELEQVPEQQEEVPASSRPSKGSDTGNPIHNDNDDDDDDDDDAFDEALEDDEASQTVPASAPPMFHRVDPGESVAEQDGLLSTMAAAPTPTLSSKANPASKTDQTAEESDEDMLGLGNASTKRAATGTPANDTKDPKDDTKDTPTKTDDKDAKSNAGGSWLNRLLGGRSSSGSNSPNDKESKAKKAHLGEATSFYYDKELKRWVNKKAGDDGQAAPAALPPPPKAKNTTKMPPTPAPTSSASDRSEASTAAAPPKPKAEAAANKETKPPVAAPSTKKPSTTSGMGDIPLPKKSNGKTDAPAGKKRPLKSRYVVID